ncbi:MAG TPA: winged helix-turn-helix domain-containing protein [Pyrinomonadaceae bacterium]|nr:winged helix-turn-helix domain-containing protein [Pyrinomonadaceae bacterium]
MHLTPHPHDGCYEFGPYRLNLVQRVLTRAGEIVSLTPKATDILALLVMNAGRVVEKDDLLKGAWADTFVEDSSLTQNIFVLRRTLGDERTGPKYIETVARRGYRFVASVRACNDDEPEGIGAYAVGNGDSVPVLGEEVVSPRLVVAVLPFINATGDASLEYLAEGVTDNIINHLSRVSKLRVMSRSAVFRHKRSEIDPQLLGKELGATAVLVGTISSRPIGIALVVELVDVETGWQLWGESFDSDSKDLLQIQDAITRQLLANLKLTLTGEEEKRVTARYTENAEAYQAYLEGRYHWSRYTRTGIEKAIGHFREAIERDPNYALAYSAIVDCYLRLATNYLPPEDDVPNFKSEILDSSGTNDPYASQHRIRLRFEWDWKGVERERRRANELNSDYPSLHQWYVAYQLSERLYTDAATEDSDITDLTRNSYLPSKICPQIPCVLLTPTEEVQILCSVARDQIAIGNYQAAALILRHWAMPGQWPNLKALNASTAADLLFTVGNLFGWIAGSKQMTHGHKHAEAFLNGAIALFEQLGIESRCVEAQVELARCYYRQGLLDLARETITIALSRLSDDQMELKTFALVIWGVIERDCGRLRQSVIKLREAARIEAAGRLVTNRCYLDLATTLKEIGFLEGEETYLGEAKLHFWRALYESEALGHHRNVGSVENNIGFLLLNLGFYDQAEQHLLRASRVFQTLSDSVRGAQVNDTLARLYVERKQLTLAQHAINRAVESLKLTDSEAILAEALTTQGVVECRQSCYGDAKRSFEAAHKIAERCGDNQGAARALLALLEEMGSEIEISEVIDFADQAKVLLCTVPQSPLLGRLENTLHNVITQHEQSK